ncbi:MarR family winged helix-turn-helix transcriptional regulator [Rhizobium sp. LjRoot254]|uniref:MarR family winged helix-turn-helix transcriptional regulator n=1 Tax=Rhizobium sp. LjRoot254 TaxID=3342297 RepID=UPI003ED0A1AF
MVDKTDDSIWMHCSNTAIRRAARQLGQLYDDCMEGTGLKGTQFALLSQIASTGEPALKQLAEAMVMDLSALGHTLKPLIRDGYVELLPDPDDRRVKRARLTEFGQKTQQTLLANWRDAQSRFDRVFGKERSEEIREALALISSPEFAKAFRKDGL